MSQTEAAIRLAGALVALAAASVLVHLPASEHVALALHALFLLGCAAVHLAPAHRAVAGLARWAVESARGMAFGALAEVRWVGFAGILLYVAGDMRAAAAAASPLDKVKGFLLFLVFLTGVWAVYLSMFTRKAAAEEDLEFLTEEKADAMQPRPARALVD